MGGPWRGGQGERGLPLGITEFEELKTILKKNLKGEFGKEKKTGKVE